jgi:hypothetical protein
MIRKGTLFVCFRDNRARIQLASFTLFACLGSVARTASGHPNASTAKNNDNETGKLAKG